MNRLIIVGNGFDLAHGMPTSYHDFLCAYLKNAIEQARISTEYNDRLISIHRNGYVHYPPDISNASSFSDIMSYLSLPSKGPMFVFADSDDDDTFGRKPYILRVKCEFVINLLEICNTCNWVDIENEYYSALKAILKENGPGDKSSKLKDLHSSFQELIDQLEKYLHTIEPKQFNMEYRKLLERPIDIDDLVTMIGKISSATITGKFSRIQNGQIPHDTLILNFNYTKTIELLLKYYADQGVKFKAAPSINCIHGSSFNKSNPIIFGFGDEIDKDYSSIESEKTNGFLRFMKSFGYFKNSNYHDLIRFIEADDFQVYIWGHSCGLSDRTMLNMIFEHLNCKSIQIFYHQRETGNNFVDLTQEVSRHFTNKAEMRKKIVSFDKSSPLPQVCQQPSKA